MIFRRKRNEKTGNYDPNIYEPVIKASICNGEQVAGFRNKKTGKFEEVMTEDNCREVLEAKGLIKKKSGYKQFASVYNANANIVD